jgi:hypothetical protein
MDGAAPSGILTIGGTILGISRGPFDLSKDPHRCVTGASVV